jgi:uncharacterized protein with FMN-binding domain
VNSKGHPTEPPAASKAAHLPGKRARRNLIALGSAAVLAVYAAGFLRTASAASRLAASERKRPAVPRVALAPAVATAPAKLRSSQPPAEPAPAPAAPAPAVAAVPPVSKPAPVLAAAVVPVEVAAVPAAPTPAPAESPAAPAPLAPPVPVVAAAPAPVAPAAAAKPAAPTFKDGIFFGWGHCRHGDLQASVEIKGGRIVASAIAQCFTRYSQNVIAALPPEVVERQSNNVDWVSGATESSDAFFYAVGEALKQAK